MGRKYLMQCLLFCLRKWQLQFCPVQLEMKLPTARSNANMLEDTVFSTQFS